MAGTSDVKKQPASGYPINDPAAGTPPALDPGKAGAAKPAGPPPKAAPVTDQDKMGARHPLLKTGQLVVPLAAPDAEASTRAIFVAPKDAADCEARTVSAQQELTALVPQLQAAEAAGQPPDPALVEEARHLQTELLQLNRFKTAFAFGLPTTGDAQPLDQSIEQARTTDKRFAKVFDKLADPKQKDPLRAAMQAVGIYVPNNRYEQPLHEMLGVPLEDVTRFVATGEMSEALFTAFESAKISPQKVYGKEFAQFSVSMAFASFVHTVSSAKINAEKTKLKTELAHVQADRSISKDQKTATKERVQAELARLELAQKAATAAFSPARKVASEATRRWSATVEREARGHARKALELKDSNPVEAEKQKELAKKQFNVLADGAERTAQSHSKRGDDKKAALATRQAVGFQLSSADVDIKVPTGGVAARPDEVDGIKKAKLAVDAIPAPPPNTVAADIVRVARADIDSARADATDPWLAQNGFAEALTSAEQTKLSAEKKKGADAHIAALEQSKGKLTPAQRKQAQLEGEDSVTATWLAARRDTQLAKLSVAQRADVDKMLTQKRQAQDSAFTGYKTSLDHLVKQPETQPGAVPKGKVNELAEITAEVAGRFSKLSTKIVNERGRLDRSQAAEAERTQMRVPADIEGLSVQEATEALERAKQEYELAKGTVNSKSSRAYAYVTRNTAENRRRMDIADEQVKKAQAQVEVAQKLEANTLTDQDVATYRVATALADHRVAELTLASAKDGLMPDEAKVAQATRREAAASKAYDSAKAEAEAPPPKGNAAEQARLASDMQFLAGTKPGSVWRSGTLEKDINQTVDAAAAWLRTAEVSPASTRDAVQGMFGVTVELANQARYGEAETLARAGRMEERLKSRLQAKEGRTLEKDATEASIATDVWVDTYVMGGVATYAAQAGTGKGVTTGPFQWLVDTDRARARVGGLSTAIDRLATNAKADTQRIAELYKQSDRLSDQRGAYAVKLGSLAALFDAAIPKDAGEERDYALSQSSQLHGERGEALAGVALAAPAAEALRLARTQGDSIAETDLRATTLFRAGAFAYRSNEALFYAMADAPLARDATTGLLKQPHALVADPFAAFHLIAAEQKASSTAARAADQAASLPDKDGKVKDASPGLVSAREECLEAEAATANRVLLQTLVPDALFDNVDSNAANASKQVTDSQQDADIAQADTIHVLAKVLTGWQNVALLETMNEGSSLAAYAQINRDKSDRREAADTLRLMLRDSYGKSGATGDAAFAMFLASQKGRPHALRLDAARALASGLQARIPDSVLLKDKFASDAEMAERRRLAEEEIPAWYRKTPEILGGWNGNVVVRGPNLGSPLVQMHVNLLNDPRFLGLRRAGRTGDMLSLLHGVQNNQELSATMRAAADVHQSTIQFVNKYGKAIMLFQEGCVLVISVACPVAIGGQAAEVGTMTSRLVALIESSSSLRTALNMENLAARAAVISRLRIAVAVLHSSGTMAAQTFLSDLSRGILGQNSEAAAALSGILQLFQFGATAQVAMGGAGRLTGLSQFAKGIAPMALDMAFRNLVIARMRDPQKAHYAETAAHLFMMIGLPAITNAHGAKEQSKLRTDQALHELVAPSGAAKASQLAELLVGGEAQKAGKKMLGDFFTSLDLHHDGASVETVAKEVARLEEAAAAHNKKHPTEPIPAALIDAVRARQTIEAVLAQTTKSLGEKPTAQQIEAAILQAQKEIANAKPSPDPAMVDALLLRPLAQMRAIGLQHLAPDKELSVAEANALALVVKGYDATLPVPATRESLVLAYTHLAQQMGLPSQAQLGFAKHAADRKLAVDSVQAAKVDATPALIDAVLAAQSRPLADVRDALTRDPSLQQLSEAQKTLLIESAVFTAAREHLQVQMVKAQSEASTSLTRQGDEKSAALIRRQAFADVAAASEAIHPDARKVLLERAAQEIASTEGQRGGPSSAEKIAKYREVFTALAKRAEIAGVVIPTEENVAKAAALLTQIDLSLSPKLAKALSTPQAITDHLVALGVKKELAAAQSAMLAERLGLLPTRTAEHNSQLEYLQSKVSVWQQSGDTKRAAAGQRAMELAKTQPALAEAALRALDNDPHGRTVDKVYELLQHQDPMYARNYMDALSAALVRHSIEASAGYKARMDIVISELTRAPARNNIAPAIAELAKARALAATDRDGASRLTTLTLGMIASRAESSMALGDEGAVSSGAISRFANDGFPPGAEPTHLLTWPNAPLPVAVRHVDHAALSRGDAEVSVEVMFHNGKTETRLVDRALLSPITLVSAQNNTTGTVRPGYILASANGRELVWNAQSHAFEVTAAGAYRPTANGKAAVDLFRQEFLQRYESRLAKLDPKERALVQDIVSQRANSPEEQMFFIKVYAARGNIQDVEMAKSLIRSYFGDEPPAPAALMRMMTSDGLVQQGEMFCGAAGLQLAKIEANPLWGLIYNALGRDGVASEQAGIMRQLGVDSMVDRSKAPVPGAGRRLQAGPAKVDPQLQVRKQEKGSTPKQIADAMNRQLSADTNASYRADWVANGDAPNPQQFAEADARLWAMMGGEGGIPPVEGVLSGLQWITTPGIPGGGHWMNVVGTEKRVSTSGEIQRFYVLRDTYSGETTAVSAAELFSAGGTQTPSGRGYLHVMLVRDAAAVHDARQLFAADVAAGDHFATQYETARHWKKSNDPTTQTRGAELEAFLVSISQSQDPALAKALTERADSISWYGMRPAIESVMRTPEPNRTQAILTLNQLAALQRDTAPILKDSLRRVRPDFALRLAEAVASGRMSKEHALAALNGLKSGYNSAQHQWFESRFNPKPTTVAATTSRPVIEQMRASRQGYADGSPLFGGLATFPGRYVIDRHGQMFEVIRSKTSHEIELAAVGGSICLQVDAALVAEMGLRSFPVEMREQLPKEAIALLADADSLAGLNIAPVMVRTLAKDMRARMAKLTMTDTQRVIAENELHTADMMMLRPAAVEIAEQTVKGTKLNPDDRETVRQVVSDALLSLDLSYISRDGFRVDGDVVRSRIERGLGDAGFAEAHAKNLADSAFLQASISLFTNQSARNKYSGPEPANQMRGPVEQLAKLLDSRDFLSTELSSLMRDARTREGTLRSRGKTLQVERQALILELMDRASACGLMRKTDGKPVGVEELQSEEAFAALLSKGVLLFDKPFRGNQHGDLTHIVQLVMLAPHINKLLAGRSKAPTNVKEFVEWLGTSDKGTQVWRELFDLPPSDLQIQVSGNIATARSPENLGRIIGSALLNPAVEANAREKMNVLADERSTRKMEDLSPWLKAKLTDAGLKDPEQVIAELLKKNGAMSALLSQPVNPQAFVDRGVRVLVEQYKLPEVLATQVLTDLMRRFSDRPKNPSPSTLYFATLGIGESQQAPFAKELAALREATRKNPSPDQPAYMKAFSAILEKYATKPEAIANEIARETQRAQAKHPEVVLRAESNAMPEQALTIELAFGSSQDSVTHIKNAKTEQALDQASRDEFDFSEVLTDAGVTLPPEQNPQFMAYAQRLTVGVESLSEAQQQFVVDTLVFQGDRFAVLHEQAPEAARAELTGALQAQGIQKEAATEIARRFSIERAVVAFSEGIQPQALMSSFHDMLDAARPQPKMREDAEAVFAAFNDLNFARDFLQWVWRGAGDGSTQSVSEKSALKFLIDHINQQNLSGGRPVALQDDLTAEVFQRVLSDGRVPMDLGFVARVHGPYSHLIQRAAIAFLNQQRSKKNLAPIDAVALQNFLMTQPNKPNGKPNLDLWDMLFDNTQTSTLAAPESLTKMFEPLLPSTSPERRIATFQARMVNAARRTLDPDVVAKRKPELQALGELAALDSRTNGIATQASREALLSLLQSESSTLTALPGLRPISELLNAEREHLRKLGAGIDLAKLGAEERALYDAALASLGEQRLALGALARLREAKPGSPLLQALQRCMTVGGPVGRYALEKLAMSEADAANVLRILKPLGAGTLHAQTQAHLDSFAGTLKGKDQEAFAQARERYTTLLHQLSHIAGPSDPRIKFADAQAMRNAAFAGFFTKLPRETQALLEQQWTAAHATGDAVYDRQGISEAGRSALRVVLEKSQSRLEQAFQDGDTGQARSFLIEQLRFLGVAKTEAHELAIGYTLHYATQIYEPMTSAKLAEFKADLTKSPLSAQHQEEVLAIVEAFNSRDFARQLLARMWTEGMARSGTGPEGALTDSQMLKAAWQQVQKLGWAGKPTILKNAESAEGFQDQMGPGPIIDHAFFGSEHGRYSHMYQWLGVALLNERRKADGKKPIDPRALQVALNDSAVSSLIWARAYDATNGTMSSPEFFTQMLGGVVRPSNYEDANALQALRTRAIMRSALPADRYHLMLPEVEAVTALSALDFRSSRTSITEGAKEVLLQLVHREGGSPEKAGKRLLLTPGGVDAELDTGRRALLEELKKAPISEPEARLLEQATTAFGNRKYAQVWLEIYRKKSSSSSRHILMQMLEVGGPVSRYALDLSVRGGLSHGIGKVLTKLLEERGEKPAGVVRFEGPDPVRQGPRIDDVAKVVGTTRALKPGEKLSDADTQTILRFVSTAARDSLAADHLRVEAQRLQAAIAEDSFSVSHTPLKESLAFEASSVAGSCGYGAAATRYLLLELGIPADKIFIHQAVKLLGASGFNHTFVTFEAPNGKRYMVDVTFRQFRRFGETGEDRIGQPGALLAQTKEGLAMADELTRIGFIELTDQNAQLWAQAMSQGHAATDVDANDFFMESTGKMDFERDELAQLATWPSPPAPAPTAVAPVANPKPSLMDAAKRSAPINPGSASASLRRSGPIIIPDGLKKTGPLQLPQPGANKPKDKDGK